MARPKKEKPQEPLEKQLWSAADKLRRTHFIINGQFL